MPYYPPPSTGTGSPGGSNTQVQFNDAGAFGGDADFTYDKVTKALVIVSGTIQATTHIFPVGANTLQLYSGTLSADRNIDLPDADGTVALTSDVAVVSASIDRFLNSLVI
jgi:hypothetical protein